MEHQWYICGQTEYDGNTKRTCIGPFMTGLLADLNYNREQTQHMVYGTTTLLPACKFNPFKQQTLRWQYNNIFCTDVKTIIMRKPTEHTQAQSLNLD